MSNLLSLHKIVLKNMTCHTTTYLKKPALFRVMLFICRRQNVPRQIASVCDLRMQREKRYFILMPGLLRYFRLWSCSSSWSTKFDFLVAFDILAVRSPYYSSPFFVLYHRPTTIV